MINIFGYVDKKKYSILSIIILIAFVFFSVPINILRAEGQKIPGPLYSDRDFVNINLSKSSDKKMYTITAESRENGGVDWLVYVIKLNNDYFSSTEDLLLKSYDNRTTFPSEDNVIEVLYAPAKSWAKKLDITGNFVETLLEEGLGYNTASSIADSVDVPIDDNAIYIIRAYSGALGLRDDETERKFIYESIDEGKNRQRMALFTNIVSVAMDIASIYYSTENILDKEGFIKSTGKSISKVTPCVTAYTQKEQSTKKEFLEIVHEAFEIIMKDYADYLIDRELDKAKVTVLNKYVSLASNSCKAALDVVMISDKISKGGQVFDRAYTFVYTATPLETSYVMSDAVTKNLMKQGEQLLNDISISVNRNSNNENNPEETIDDDSNSQLQEENDENDKSADNESTSTTDKKEIDDVNITKLTIEFVDQYGHNVIPAKNSRRGHGMIFGDWYSELKIFDAIDDSLSGSFKATTKNDKVVYEYNKDIIAGEYKLQLGQTANEYYTSFIRYYLPIDAAIIVESDNDLYHKINITQEAIGYLGVLNITLIVTNQLGTPLSLSLGASGEKRYLVNELGNKVGSGFSPMLEEDGKYKVGTSGHYIEPGGYTVHIKEKGYNPVEITFTLPDLRQYTDEKIINMDFGEIDLGTIILEKL